MSGAPTRPTFRTSGSSPGPSPSTSYSSNAPPKPIIRSVSNGPPNTTPPATPPFQPADAGTKVAFPFDSSGSPGPTRARVDDHDHDHVSRNAAGLHSAFSHTHRNHSSSHDLYLKGLEAAAMPGSASAALLSPTRGPSHGYGMPRTRTSSTGAGTAIGPEFGYRRKVGFETFEKSTDSALFAHTLQAKSEGYRRTRNTRVFQVAVSSDESGQEALDWLMESLIEDGDEIVALRVIELDDGEKASSRAQDELREEAAQLLNSILEKNHEFGDRRVSVIVEYAAGVVTDTIMRLISLYRPDSLVVGTKGKKPSMLQNLGIGIGSVSRYCVSHSPVPVIVVRPERKVKKALAKRQNDPKRKGQYANMVGGATLIRSRSADRSE